MMPASAASTAPRSEVSSQGCTTMVGTAGTALRRRDQAIVLAGARGVSLVSAGMTFMAVTPDLSNERYDAFAFGSKGTTSMPFRNSSHRRRTARPPASDAWRPRRISRRWPTALRGSPRNRLAALIRIVRQQLRNGRQRGLLIQQQHEELLAHQHLELRQREPRPIRPLGEPAATPQGCARPPFRAPTRHRAGRGWRLPCRPPSPIFDFSSAMRASSSSRCSSRHLAPARRRRLRIDADSGLQRRRAVDRKEHRFAERLLRVAPIVERIDDLLRDLFLEGEEGIVCGDRLALLARLVRRVLHRLHERILAAESLILQPQRMPVAHHLRHLRRHHAT